MFDFKEFGKRIKNRRIELNMTQADLAKKAGYTSRSSINKIELGLVDITQSRIVALATALNMSPIELLGYEPPRESVFLTEHEYMLINAYRKRKELQQSVDNILGISVRPSVIDYSKNLFTAADSDNNTPPSAMQKSKEQWRVIETAPETDEEL